MKKYILLLGLVVSAGSLAFCQGNVKFEIGFQGAKAMYQGDLSPVPTFKSGDYSAGIWFKKQYTPHLGIRIGLMQSSLSGYDSASTNGFQLRRNLSFQSAVTELSVMGEFNFYPYRPGMKGYNFTPYISSGLALDFFKTSAVFGTGSVLLHNVGTEGQVFLIAGHKEQYSRTCLALPFNVGMKWYLGGKWQMAVEAGVRWLKSDYLDDVSTVYPGEQKYAIERQGYNLKYSDRSVEIGQSFFPAGKQRGVSTFDDTYYYFGATFIYTVTSGTCPAFKH